MGIGEKMGKKRILSLDIIRCAAIFFVISVHFFLNSDFYQTDLSTGGMFVLSCFRWLFFTCIAIFLLLTGYLNNATKFDKDYFYKIFRVLIPYIIIGIISLMFKKFYFGQDITVVRGIIYLFNFSANDYAWYVEMYIGLFLLIPFLNVLYNNLKSKKSKTKLIVVLSFIFSLTVTTRFFYPTNYVINAFSDYWITGYPLLYFFFGKYLKEYPLKIKNIKLILILIILFLIQSGLIFVFNYNKTYPMELFSGYAGGYYNLFTVFEAIIIFSLLFRINLNGKIKTKFITTISLVSFEMYLVSAIIDGIFYNEMNLQFGNAFNYLVSYLFSVPIIFLLSFVFGFIIHKVSNFIYMKFKTIYDKIYKKVSKFIKGVCLCFQN